MPSSSHLGELRLGLGQTNSADFVQEVDLGITNNVVDPRVTNPLPEGLNSALFLALLAAVGGHLPFEMGLFDTALFLRQTFGCHGSHSSLGRMALLLDGQGVHHGGEHFGLEFVDGNHCSF